MQREERPKRNGRGKRRKGRVESRLGDEGKFSCSVCGADDIWEKGAGRLGGAERWSGQQAQHLLMGRIMISLCQIARGHKGKQKIVLSSARGR